MKRVIFTEKDKNIDTPYSPAIAYKDLLFISGQIPYDKENKRVIYGGIREQVRLCLDNLKEILKKAGCNLDDVVKVTVFLSEMSDYEDMNNVYREYFKNNKPARSCIQASKLPYEVKVEIEAIAVIPNISEN
jgi:2-iminobutanoate/2-iminopropanoate deaminase